MNILLGITGSVAATLTPKLCRALKEIGNVKVVCTESSRRFFSWYDVEVIIDPMGHVGDLCIYTDNITKSTKYDKSEDIHHITLGNWADVFVVAPLTCNTLAKLANGICDNLLTSTFMAWDFSKYVIIAPAMNTRMWVNPITQKNLLTLEDLYTYNVESCMEITLRMIKPVGPIYKELACGDVGVGGMADIKNIIDTVNYTVKMRKLHEEQEQNKAAK